MQDLQNKIMFCEHLILWSSKRSVNENEVKNKNNARTTDTKHNLNKNNTFVSLAYTIVFNVFNYHLS